MYAVPDPSSILQVGFGFFGSKVLLSAIELELFTKLGSQSLTAKQLGDQLGLHPRAHFDFFDALTSLGFLVREGTGETATYRNSAATSFHLDKNKPDQYVGGIMEMANARLYRFWGDLTTALKTGKPQNEIKSTGKSMFGELYSDPARLEQFMNAMAGISRPNFLALADKIDFSPYKTLCDVGGATGLLAKSVAARHPHLKCISFDLPVVEPIARESIRKAGLSDRITAVSGDFFKDGLPKADVITMGMILHDWNLKDKLMLIGKAYEALPAGGALIAVENLIDDARTENSFGLLMSLNMLIEFGDAFDYTGADFAGWCKQAGFKRTEVVHLNGPCSAAIAYK